MGEGGPIRRLVPWSGQDRRTAWAQGAGGDGAEWMDSECILEVKPKGLVDVKNEGKGEIKIDS